MDLLGHVSCINEESKTDNSNTVHFVQFWQRRSAVHSYTWNTYNISASDELRLEYHGNICTDPVTGKPTVYYPSWKRKLWYMFSFLSMLPLLSVGVGVMTLSLNLNGYVKNTESPIYVEFLATFAQPVSQEDTILRPL